MGGRWGLRAVVDERRGERESLARQRGRRWDGVVVVGVAVRGGELMCCDGVVRTIVVAVVVEVRGRIVAKRM